MVAGRLTFGLTSITSIVSFGDFAQAVVLIVGTLVYIGEKLGVC